MNINYPQLNEKKVREFSSNLGIPESIARFLLNRNVDEEEANKILSNNFSFITSPFLFSQMEKVVERLKKAREKKEKILIYGDYDADGITASAIVYLYLKEKGYNVEVFIPHRIADGYSINLEAIKREGLENFSLLISVDCGITSIQEVAILKREGIDTIITDHHEPPALLPQAFAIINPKLEDYPYTNLSGAGVALKLIEALALQLEGEEERKAVLKRFLPLAAVGTIADVMELRGENRAFVKYGLRLLNDFTPLRVLAEVAGIFKDSYEPWDVSFVLAPRLNAPGRISHAKKAFELLVEKDNEKVVELAKLLNKENQKRQREQETIFREALELAKDQQLPFILLAGENWHPGVIGIVASKLATHFKKPALVISLNGEETGRGSGRSYGNLNLYEVISKCKEVFEAWGGHEKAVGFKIKKEKISALKEKLLRNLEKVTYEEESLSVDSILNFEDIDINFVRVISKLKPFGEGFGEPLFLFRNVKIKWVRGKKAFIIQNNIGIEGYCEIEIATGVYDIVATVDFENRANTKSLIIRVKNAERL